MVIYYDPVSHPLFPDSRLLSRVMCTEMRWGVDPKEGTKPHGDVSRRFEKIPEPTATRSQQLIANIQKSHLSLESSVLFALNSPPNIPDNGWDRLLQALGDIQDC